MNFGPAYQSWGMTSAWMYIARHPSLWPRVIGLYASKAFFYLDLVCLRDFGRPITSGRYRALDHGHVVMERIMPRSAVDETEEGRDE
jgi:hypothetical protein